MLTWFSANLTNIAVVGIVLVLLALAAWFFYEFCRALLA